jgi:hypothetical protein
MHTFFHGWRRKAGVVTLVMALVFAAIWVGGISEPRSLVLNLAGQDHQFTTDSGRLIWISEDGFYSRLSSTSLDVPTLAMALLSAYLILWKPRKRDA